MAAKQKYFRIINESGETQGCGQARYISTFRALVEACGLGLGFIIVTTPLAFVPLIHLVAIPAGLVGGVLVPIFMFRRRRNKLDILQASGPCPHCHSAMQFDLDDISKSSFASICRHCHSSFTVPLIEA